MRREAKRGRCAASLGSAVRTGAGRARPLSGLTPPAHLLLPAQPYPALHRRLVFAVSPVRPHAGGTVHLLPLFDAIAVARTAPLPRRMDAERMHEGDEPRGRGNTLDPQQGAASFGDR